MQFNISKYLKYLDSQILGKNIEYIKETQSTNNDLWHKIKNKEHYIVIADSQKKGKGRRGNRWYSVKEKSLTFSVGLIKNNIDNLIPFKVSLSICRAINKISNINTKIKWPNDIVLNNKKIAGILIESKMKDKKIIYNIGIGINVNLGAHELDSKLKNNMSSILIESNQIQNRELLLSEFMKLLETTMDDDDDDIIDKWIGNCAHLNNEVFFHNENISINGTFLGINSDGKAIIKSDNKINYYTSGIIES